jgi:hypothetical protein
MAPDVKSCPANRHRAHAATRTIFEVAGAEAKPSTRADGVSSRPAIDGRLCPRQIRMGAAHAICGSGRFVSGFRLVTEMTPEDRAFFDRFKLWKHRPKDFSPSSENDPTPQQMYDRLMKETFAPALRAAGLKGSGGRFELPSEKYWSQLGFQKSAYSDSSALKFTVNLSVISREVWAEQAAAKPHLGKKPAPSVFYGSWADQVRIGDLTTSGEDLWWSLNRGDDPSPMAEQVVSTLLELAVPWLVAKSNA